MFQNNSVLKQYIRVGSSFFPLFSYLFGYHLSTLIRAKVFFRYFSPIKKNKSFVVFFVGAFIQKKCPRVAIGFDFEDQRNLQILDKFLQYGIWLLALEPPRTW